MCFVFVFAALLEYAAVNYTYWGARAKKKKKEKKQREKEEKENSVLLAASAAPPPTVSGSAGKGLRLIHITAFSACVCGRWLRCSAEIEKFLSLRWRSPLWNPQTAAASVNEPLFTLDAAVCVFRSGLRQHRDRKFSISLQKRNRLPQMRAENAVMWMSLKAPCSGWLAMDSVTRLGDLWHFGQLFKAWGNNYFAKIAHIFRQIL